MHKLNFNNGTPDQRAEAKARSRAIMRKQLAQMNAGQPEPSAGEQVLAASSPKSLLRASMERLLKQEGALE